MTQDATAVDPPTADPCWEGPWRSPRPDEQFWVLAALNRTVHALPALHPWRLADTKGTSRVLLWSAGAVTAPQGLATFTRTARDPDLPTGSFDGPDRLDALDALDVLDALRPPSSTTGAADAVCWVGGMARLTGSWLPGLAILPRRSRELDDPGTRWSTESLDFAERHTVHADDTRFAADVLAPHVMALILDRVPDDAALTVAGDAVHLWLPYTSAAAKRGGLAAGLTATAVTIGDAIPSFVTADHVDRSDEVEQQLAARAAAAEEYRRRRERSRSTDPHLQRIYRDAQAAWQDEDLSSRP